MGWTPSARAIDFSVVYFDGAAEGARVRRAFFPDGNQRLVFRMDSKTTVNGMGYAAVFQFEGLDGAAVRLARSRSNPEISFSGKNLEQYRIMARDGLPANAENVRLEGEIPDAFNINGWKSYQIVMAFEVNAVAHRRTVTFLNYTGQDQIVVTMEAPLNIFPQVAGRGWRILNSFDRVGDEKVSGPGSGS
jgi:hypothetical protein